MVVREVVAIRGTRSNSSSGNSGIDCNSSSGSESGNESGDGSSNDSGGWR